MVVVAVVVGVAQALTPDAVAYAMRLHTKHMLDAYADDASIPH